jgi:hypothetical protein
VPNVILLIVWIVLDGALKGTFYNLDKDPSVYYYSCTGLTSELGKSLFSTMISWSLVVSSAIVLFASVSGEYSRSTFKELKFIKFSVSYQDMQALVILLFGFPMCRATIFSF